MRVRLPAAAALTAITTSLIMTMTPGSALAAETSDTPTALPVPQGLTVSRAQDDATKMVMSWDSVPEADFYRVNTLKGSTDTVTFVPAGTTSYPINVPNPCDSYRVRVATENEAGTGEYTPFGDGRALAPGTVMGMTTGREGAGGSVGTVTWRLPYWPGYTPITGYRMQVSRLADGVVLSDEVTTTMEHRFPDMDPARAHTIQVSAFNEYGTCSTAKSLIDRYRPADPTEVVATRRANSTTVDLSWKAPTGNPVAEYYLIKYTSGTTTATVKVNAPLTSTTLNLARGKNWTVEVKSYNYIGGSGAATAVVTDPTAPVIPPAVTPPPAAPEKTPPTITAALTRAPDRNGWHNGPVSVIFTCVDAQSGIATCTSPVTLTTDGADQLVTGTVTDKAGNTASTTVRVSLDRTAPTVVATVDGTRNAAGWYRTAPTVSYSCADSGSGVGSCPAPVAVGTDGAGQSVTAAGSDRAGNTAGTTVTGLNVDTVAPQSRILGVTAGTPYGPDALPTASCDTVDTGSGVDRPAGLAVRRDDRGRYTATCSGGTDVAGNSAATTTLTYTVTPTIPSLIALTNRYLDANNATVGSHQDLTNKLSHGQYALYLSKVRQEATGKRAGLTTAQADELSYWANLLMG